MALRSGTMGRILWPDWAPVVFDGETYYWTSYSWSPRAEDGPVPEGGPSGPIECLDISRQPNTPGTGRVFPPGTEVTEQDAVELLRLAKEHGVVLP
jgi:hypothetical protein